MKRNINIDFLKTLAVIAVVMTHVIGDMLEFQVGSSTWIYGVIINTLVKYCVPVFIMCTGALMLGEKEISVKKIYTKYIPRFIVALVFWDSCYKIMNAYYEYKTQNLASMEILKNLEGNIWG